MTSNDYSRHCTRTLKATVITLNDGACEGKVTDDTGPVVVEMLKNHFSKTPFSLQMETVLLGFDATALRYKVIDCVARDVDMVFTIGGTGIGRRDITPETLLSLFHKEIPGIMDFIRMKHGTALPEALISRSVAGVIGETQVYALPGEVEAVREYMSEIQRILIHNFMMLRGTDATE